MTYKRKRIMMSNTYNFEKSYNFRHELRKV